MPILDLSKTLMYDFHYNWVKKQDFESKLLFTDTDYHIKENIENAMKKDSHLFDFSKYNKEDLQLNQESHTYVQERVYKRWNH